MNKEQLEIKTTIQIQKTALEVFEAIVDPDKMKNYFISESSGRMEEGLLLRWKFPEFAEVFPIRVGKLIPGEYISFYWEMDGIELLIEMQLKAQPDNSTVITVTEKSRENDASGIRWLKSNTEGWANFLAFLKAYMEYGINLRIGAFDFMKGQLPV